MCDLALFCGEKNARALQPGDRLVTSMREAVAAIAMPPVGRLWFDILRPPVLLSPVYYLAHGASRFASNCTLAYLHAKARGSHYYLTASEQIEIPNFPPVPSLSAAELQILEWVQTIYSGDIFARLEDISGPVLALRHQYLAVLRSHLTAMRRQRVANCTALLNLEERITRQLRQEHSAFF